MLGDYKSDLKILKFLRTYYTRQVYLMSVSLLQISMTMTNVLINIANDL